jgi:hypothetical protein
MSFNASNFGLKNPRNNAGVGTSTLNRRNQSKVRQVETGTNHRIFFFFYSLPSHSKLGVVE